MTDEKEEIYEISYNSNNEIESEKKKKISWHNKEYHPHLLSENKTGKIIGWLGDKNIINKQTESKLRVSKYSLAKKIEESIITGIAGLALVGFLAGSYNYLSNKEKNVHSQEIQFNKDSNSNNLWIKTARNELEAKKENRNIGRKLNKEAQKSRLYKSRIKEIEKQKKTLERMLKDQKSTLSVEDMSLCKPNVAYRLEYTLGRNIDEHSVSITSKEGGKISSYNITLCGAGILYNKAVLLKIVGKERSQKMLKKFSKGDLNLKIERYIMIQKDSKGFIKNAKELTKEQKKISRDYFKKFE